MAKYQPKTPCAIAANAWGQEYAASSYRATDQGVVEICGPLVQHPDPQGCFDSYDQIRERVRAVTGPITLKIDSPGGDVAGCFELARDIRAMAAGRPITAYVDGQACSAGYALACAADRIVVPSTGAVGSIGVVTGVVDATAANTAQGLRIEMVTSGARKADGNPNNPLTDEVLAAVQGTVDKLAQVFFDWVAVRRGFDPKYLEAAIFHGQDAVSQGLADAVMTWSELRSEKSNANLNATSEPTKRTMKYQEIVSALKAAADEGDEDSKKALAKIEAEEMPSKEEEEKPEPATAESEDMPSDEEEPKKKKPAPEALALAAKVLRLEAKLTALSEKDERSTVLASRPDLATNKEVSAFLATLSLPALKSACKSLPKPAAVVASGNASVPGKLGATQSQTSSLPSHEKRRLDLRMGLVKPSDGITKRDGKITFGSSE